MGHELGATVVLVHVVCSLDQMEEMLLVEVEFDHGCFVVLGNRATDHRLEGLWTLVAYWQYHGGSSQQTSVGASNPSCDPWGGYETTV